jgi:hypothetical protein
MKYKNFSIVPTHVGISIKPNNGDSDVEVCLTVDKDTLTIDVHVIKEVEEVKTYKVKL